MEKHSPYKRRSGLPRSKCKYKVLGFLSSRASKVPYSDGDEVSCIRGYHEAGLVGRVDVEYEPGEALAKNGLKCDPVRGLASRVGGAKHIT